MPASPTPSSSPHAPPPSPWLLAMELRAPWELGAVIPAWPVLQKAPTGDGHSVLVYPGLGTNDTSTLPLRRYLASLGHRVQGWDQGFNLGPRHGVLDLAKTRIRETCDATGRKVSLVGWSLGGVYARELAKELPECVRTVVTLGTPFAGSHRSTHAWRLYELTSGRQIHLDAEHYDLPAAPPVPTTSVFSRTDGIVSWTCSIQPPCAINPHTENVEVIASHIGIGLNPSVWWAVADRLAQAEGLWRPFRETQGRHHRLKGLIYPDPHR